MKIRLAQKIMNTYYRYMCDIDEWMPYNRGQREKARRKMFSVYSKNISL